MHIGIDASRAFVAQKTGTENYSFQLIKALAKIDKRNTYSLYVRDFSLQKFPPNFHLKVIPWPRFWTQGGLALECLFHPPDILFIPAHTMPVIRRSRLATVVTIHDLGFEYLPAYHQFPQRLYLNKSTIYAKNWATYLIAVSQATRRDLITKLHCDPKKIKVIYEGVDHRKFEIRNWKFEMVRQAHHPERSRGTNSKFQIQNSKLKTKYGIDGEYLLFVGTIQPRKNLGRLIEAYSRLKTQYLIQLVIVGKPGWLYKEIYEAPKKFGVEKGVKFLDYVPEEDLPFLYSGALFLVLPSLCEGFGLPVLEAMACGCPVVVSNLSSLPEIVGEAGIKVNPYDVGDIAKNLQFVIDNEELRNDLRKKGLAQVKKFSWEKTAQETLEVLEKTYRDRK